MMRAFGLRELSRFRRMRCAVRGAPLRDNRRRFAA